MQRPRFHTRQTTFRQLETFLAVAERLSVTEAARALHLAHAALVDRQRPREAGSRRAAPPTWHPFAGAQPILSSILSVSLLLH